MVLKKSRLKSQLKEIYARSFRDFDQIAFSEDIKEISYEGVFKNDDPEQALGRLFSQISSIVDFHCPLRTIRITIGKPKYLTDRIMPLLH